MTLHQRFFEACKTRFGNGTKVLTENNLCQPAIYHLQQAFEKCIKSYFIFKEVNINKIDEDAVYDGVTKLSQKTEISTITLLKDMLPSISDVPTRNIIQIFITQIDNYKLQLDRLVPSQDLRTNYTWSL